MNGGQVAVWIILAVILVAAIFLFLFLSQEIEINTISSGTEISSFLDSCLEPTVQSASEIMLPRGGLIKKKNTLFFNFQEVEYLCANMGFFEPCINQHPLLIREMEEELEEYLNPEVDICFNELRENIENRGEDFYFVPEYELEVSIVPDKIVLDILREGVYTSKSGEKNSYENFRAEYRSGAHGLATIALEIAAQEANYCYFESTGYSLFYPRYKITRYQLSHPAKVYLINDTAMNEHMMIAIRSCAMPPGV